MRNDIINYLKEEIYSRAIKPENKFGIGVYYHIEAVAKNAEILADQYNADIEVVIIAPSFLNAFFIFSWYCIYYRL